MTNAGRLQKMTWVSIALLASLSTVVAQENRLRWDGFLSVGAARTFAADEEFRADPAGFGYHDEDVDFAPDTVFGLQAHIDLQEGLSATAQIIARGSEEFDANLEWAYVSYDFLENWSLSAGRKRYPLFFYSQTLEVAYSYHWIRLPGEVYSTTLTSYDGANLRHKCSLGPLDSKVDLWAGTAEAPLPNLPHYGMALKDMGGLAWNVGFEDWVQSRLIYSYSTIDFSANDIVFNEGNDTKFYGAALAVDRDRWFVVSEYTAVHFEKQWNNQHNWYVSGGLRFGAFTPHITYGELKEVRSPGAPTSPAEQQDSITIGLRYDFHPRAALKIEYAAVHDQSDPGEEVNGNSELISIAVDLTF